MIPIKVVTVDDHDLLRYGLSVVLSAYYPEIELIGEARNGLEAVALCEQLHPDVTLMDLNMPEINGITATKLIRERAPRTQVIVLTSFTDEHLITEALQAGISSYLIKDVSHLELIEAIRAVQRQEQPILTQAGRSPTGLSDV